MISKHIFLCFFLIFARNNDAENSQKVILKNSKLKIGKEHLFLSKFDLKIKKKLRFLFFFHFEKMLFDKMSIFWVK